MVVAVESVLAGPLDAVSVVEYFKLEYDDELSVNTLALLLYSVLRSSLEALSKLRVSRLEDSTLLSGEEV